MGNARSRVAGVGRTRLARRACPHMGSTTRIGATAGLAGRTCSDMGCARSPGRAARRAAASSAATVCSALVCLGRAAAAGLHRTTGMGSPTGACCRGSGRFASARPVCAVCAVCAVVEPAGSRVGSPPAAGRFGASGARRE
ncbi:MAG: hypothetical protein ABI334_03360 [Candidatus Dormiibacterota bacterium]